MIPTWLMILAGLFVLAVLLQLLYGTWMEGQTKRDMDQIRRMREAAARNIDGITKAAEDKAKDIKKRDEKDITNRKKRDWRDLDL